VERLDDLAYDAVPDLVPLEAYFVLSEPTGKTGYGDKFNA